MMIDYRKTAYDLMRKLREGENPGKELHERAIHLLRGSQDDIENASHLYEHTHRLAQSVECQNVYTRGVAELGLGWCRLIQGVGDRGKAPETESWLTSAIRNLRQAHENGCATDARGEGIAFIARGIFYQEIEDFDRALKSLTRARDVLKNLPDDDGLLAVVCDWKSYISQRIAGSSAPPPVSPTPDVRPPGGTDTLPLTPGVPPTHSSVPSGGTDPTPQPSPTKLVSGRPTIRRIPVVARIAAGEEILAEENIEDEIALDEDHARGATFALQVEGESMVNVGILDGDYVFIRQLPKAENGQIAAVMIQKVDTEATLKRFYKEANHFRLKPENDAERTIIVVPRTEDKEAVKELYRKRGVRARLIVGTEVDVVGPVVLVMRAL